MINILYAINLYRAGAELVAVQQNKPTRAKRGMRRSHDALIAVAHLSIDKTSGEVHLRHHVTANGYYLGRRVITKS